MFIPLILFQKRIQVPPKPSRPSHRHIRRPFRETPPNGRKRPRIAANGRENPRTETKTMLFAMFRAHRFQDENHDVHNLSQIQCLRPLRPSPEPRRLRLEAQVADLSTQKLHFQSCCEDVHESTLYKVFRAPPDGYQKSFGARNTAHSAVSCMYDCLCVFMISPRKQYLGTPFIIPLERVPRYCFCWFFCFFCLLNGFSNILGKKASRP